MNKAQVSLKMSLFAAAAMMFVISLKGVAQQTSAGTEIKNQIIILYTGSNNTGHSTASNVVTVTVARIAGLRITPDGGGGTSVVPGQRGVPFTFQVTSTSNFSNQVRFLANGMSIRVVGPATVASAVIDLPGSATDVNIHTNAADVLHSLTQDSSVDILVSLDINVSAIAGNTVQVFLGDAVAGTNFDNVTADSSAHEVRTVLTSKNGLREARGDVSTTVTAPEVLIGPNGTPDATGPTNNNDDYTNLSVESTIGPQSGPVIGDSTSVTGSAITAVFINTVRNTSSANDVFVLTAPVAPVGATVEISTDGGVTHTTISGGGSVNLAVAAVSSVNINVRITIPAGSRLLTGHDTVIRAASQSDNAKRNETIDRIYAGFVELQVSATPTDPGPGDEITFDITYTNISSTGGTGSVALPATNLTIMVNDSILQNSNWGVTTDHVVGSAIDTRGGTITGDASATSNRLTVIILSLPPGASGTFSFKRKVK